MTFLQRTFTSLVHAHAGRTQTQARGQISATHFGMASPFYAKILHYNLPVLRALGETWRVYKYDSGKINTKLRVLVALMSALG